MFRKSKIKSSLITVDDQPKAQVVAPKKEIPGAKRNCRVVGWEYKYPPTQETSDNCPNPNS